MATIKPLADKVLVKILEEEEKTPGAFTCPILPKRSPSRAKSSPSGRASN
jgi:co-chaperonin GroES (HSP10)